MSSINIRPTRESDFKPIYEQKTISSTKNRDGSDKPKQGEVTKVLVSGRHVDGLVLFYFDDQNGIEHAYVDIGRIAVIRKSEDVF